MDFSLTPEQQELKDIARELARDFAARSLQHGEERSLPVENFAALRDAGMYGLGIPKEHGGMGAGLVGWVAVAEELAQGDASTALGLTMHVGATGGITHRSEVSAELRERVAKLAVEDGKLIATSVSEPATSSLLPAAFNPCVEARAENGGVRTLP